MMNNYPDKIYLKGHIFEGDFYQEDFSFSSVDGYVEYIRESKPLTQPNQTLIEAFSDSCVACGKNASNIASNMEAGVCFYDGKQRIIHNKCLVKLIAEKNKNLSTKMMLDALKAIVDFDDTDFITDMSDGVDSWQSNGLSSLISKAREAIAAASSAPVVEVVHGLEEALKASETYGESRRNNWDMKAILEAAPSTRTAER